MENTETGLEPAPGAEPTSIIPSPFAAKVADAGSARVLEQLRWVSLEHRADFHQVAALEEPNVEARAAVRAVLGLSPDVLAALGEVTRLSDEDVQIIMATLALPPEVQATLRAILV